MYTQVNNRIKAVSSE